MLSTLELLKDTEALLEDRGHEYEFGDWSRCTCGFIYAARNNGQFLPARGEGDSSPTGTNPDAHNAMECDDVYAEGIKAVATVLGWEVNPLALKNFGGSPTQQAMGYVSDQTGVKHRNQSHTYRQAALSVVREAIAKIEAHEEEARVKIIDEARFALV